MALQTTAKKGEPFVPEKNAGEGARQYKLLSPNTPDRLPTMAADWTKYDKPTCRSL